MRAGILLIFQSVKIDLSAALSKGAHFRGVPFVFLTTLLLLSAVGFAKSKKSESAEIQVAIQEAEAALAKRNRGEALAILIAAKKSIEDERLRVRLVEVEKTVSQVFIAEKAQQSYEVAISLRTKDLQQELIKLQEAAFADGSNFLIRLEMGRVLIGQGKCTEGLMMAEEILKQNPEEELAQLLSDQARMCKGLPLQYLGVATKGRDPSLVWAWQFLQIEADLKKKNFLKAEATFLAVDNKIQTRYPDADYFEMAIKDHQGSTENVWIDTYRNKCTSFSLAEGRRWLVDPNLCWRKPESLLKTRP